MLRNPLKPIILLFAFSCSFILGNTVKDINMPDYSKNNDIKMMAQSQNKFAKDLYMTLANEQSGNLFFSPFSISTALSMVYLGSNGNTQAQMKDTLHLTADQGSIRKAFFTFISDIKKGSSDYELRTSNLIYVSDKMKLLNEFQSALTKDFLSSSKPADFNHHEKVRLEINQEVEKETNSKIKDIIPQGVLDSRTRLVLVNAIYLKGLWEHQFSPEKTKAADFWVTASEAVKVEMMHAEKKFRVAYPTHLDAAVLAMDYKGGRLSFVIVLPNERDGLAALEKKLSSADFENLDAQSMTQKITVAIPKFKLEETIDMNNVLTKMGMKDMFDKQKADFSLMTADDDLYVSNVIHKAFLEVNEEGAEAAAATVAAVRMKRSLDERVWVVADRPFLFVIRDAASGLCLFAGRFSDPPHRRTLHRDEL